MTLDKALRGQKIKIISLPDDLTRARAISFGISEGTVVTCREVVPAGPVVIARNKREIAIGRNLARLIGVEPAEKSLTQEKRFSSRLPKKAGFL